MEAAETTSTRPGDGECAVLASWVSSLVLRMLSVFVAARDQSERAAAAIADARAA
jgi:hypothetical protein